MTTSMLNLGRQVNYKSVLQDLGLRPRSPIIPSIMHCPFCRERQFWLYADPWWCGYWAHCRSCDWAGDLVELTAAARGCSIPAAVRYLRESHPGLPTDDATIEEYLARYVNRRKALNAFWEESRENLRYRRIEDIADLQHRMQISPTDVGSWPHRGGKFVGTTTHKRALQVIAPYYCDGNTIISTSPKVFTYSGKPSRQGRWGPLFVFAFRDLPGRISRFMFVGRRASAENGDFFYYQASPNRGRKPRDPGILMLETLIEPTERAVKDWVLAIPDPLDAVRLQLRHLTTSPRPLPVIGTQLEVPQFEPFPAWRQLSDRKMVFMAPDANPEVIRLAHRMTARVATNKSADARLEQVASKWGPVPFARKMQEAALTCPQAIESVLADLDDNQARQYLEQLQLSVGEMEDIAEKSSPETKPRILRHLYHRHGNTKCVTIDDIRISEEDGHWVATSTSRNRYRTLSNGIIRVHKILTNGRDKAYFVGEVIFKGASHPFTASKEFANAPFVWCQKFLNNKGVPGYRCSRRRAWLAMPTITAFHEPKTVHVPERVGWNPEEQAFVFPQFVLHQSGKVLDEYTPSTKTGRYLSGPAVFAEIEGEELPGADICHPKHVAFTHAEIETLSQNNRKAQAFWEVAVAILHNLIAPAIDSRPEPFVLSGTARNECAVAASLLGCLGASRHIWSPARLEQKCRAHGIPVIIRKIPSELLDGWTVKVTDLNCFIMADRPDARILAEQGCKAIYVNSVDDVREFREPAKKVISSYLQWLGSKWMALPPLPLYAAIAADLANWLRDKGGDGTVLDEIREMVVAQ